MNNYIYIICALIACFGSPSICCAEGNKLSKNGDVRIALVDHKVDPCNIKYSYWLKCLEGISGQVVIDLNVSDFWISVRRVEENKIIVICRAGSKIGHSLVMLGRDDENIEHAKQEGDPISYAVKLNKKDIIFAYTLKVPDEAVRIRILPNGIEGKYEVSLK